MATSPWVVETAALGAAAALGGADFLRLGQGGVSKKLTITALLAGLAISTLAAGTLTTSQPMTLTQTWNAAADFVGFSIDITSTSSNANSLPFRVRVGGADIAGLTKAGGWRGAAGTAAAPTYSFEDTSWSAGTYAGFYYSGGVKFVSANGNVTVGFHHTGLHLASGIGIVFGSVAPGSGSASLILDAANVLAQRNGTTAQTLNVYGTWTDASNYVRASLTIDTASLILDAQGAGSGSPQQFLIRVKGQDYLVGNNNSGLLIFSSGTTTTTQRWQISATGHFLAIADNTYDIGASGATRPRNIYCAGTLTISHVSASGNLVAGSGGLLAWGSRSNVLSPSDGNLTFTNAAQTSFDLLQLGGTTSSFPALKRSTTSIQVRLADDSAFTFVQGKHRTEANAVSEAITPTHSLTMWDAGGTAYKVAVQAA